MIKEGSDESFKSSLRHSICFGGTGCCRAAEYERRGQRSQRQKSRDTSASQIGASRKARRVGG
jgi:hypothetical protein